MPNYNVPHSATPIITAKVHGEAQPRFVLLADGSILTGSGSSAVAGDGVLTLTNKTSDFTVSSAEVGNRYQISSASAITVTIPTNANDGIQVGATFELVRRGAGVVAVSASGGVTLNSVYSYVNLARQYSAATLVKVGTDEWDLHGDLA